MGNLSRNFYIKNSNISTTNRENNNPSMFYEGLGWCCAFGLESIAIILGNLLTIGAFAKKKYLRKRGTYLLINLATADVFIGIIPIPLYIYFIGIQFQLWQAYFLKTITYVFYVADILLGVASLGNLTIVALERLYAAKKPFRYRTLHPRYYYTAIAVTWTLACAIAIFCFSALYLTSNYIISTYTSMIVVFIAFILITTSYSIVWSRLKLHSSKNYRKASENERKLGVTMIILTVLSLSAWLPFVIMNLVVVFAKLTVDNYIIIHATKLLHFGNSLTNCFVYAWRMPDFRRAVLKLIKLGKHDNSGQNSPVETSAISPLHNSRRPQYSRALSNYSPQHRLSMKAL
ncbi:adenosine receptor A3-like [Actinia tenebrosa]|uniref:Adenosine receptor A3-like n=1 Tax=Actinia tenebrosa TaxID=6105 RepID=A0A6P8H5R9_ACTTE|nr:adenosine receptor A3-like [Actinia tenebrosa]